MEVLESNKTEQQILEAAYRVFQKKGKAGARMQEIADEAGINKSMLHYYFRNKESLFKKIFLQSITEFLGAVIPLINNLNTSWEEKIKELVKHYILFMRHRPDLPFFVMNEINQNSQEFFQHLNVNIGDILLKSVFFKQLQQEMQEGKIKTINPLQIFISIVSNIIFPFIAAPMLKKVASMSDKDWELFLDEREILTIELIINYIHKK